MKKEVIDRIENGIVVLVDSTGRSRNVALKDFPVGVKEGDVIVDGNIDNKQTKKAKDRVNNLLKEILRKEREGTRDGTANR